MPYESQWLDQEQIEEQLRNVNAYFKLCDENRDKAIKGGHVERDKVEGKAFAYWQEGSPKEVMFMVWNFRCMPPPGNLILDRRCYVLKMHGPPAQYPDVNDAILLDVTVDEFFNYALREFDTAWLNPLNQKNYDSPYAMFQRSMENICKGDTPFNIHRCTEELRKERGWDAEDWTEDPWVIGPDGAVYPMTTPKQRVYADMALAMKLQLQVPLYTGPQHDRKFVRTYHADYRPLIHDNPHTEPHASGLWNPYDQDGRGAGASDQAQCDDTGSGGAEVITFPGAAKRDGGKDPGDGKAG